MTTKRSISILCLLVVSNLSYANLTVQDGNYLVVTHSNESLHIDLPGMDLIAIDPQNGTLGVIMRPAYVEVGTISLVSANGLIGDSYRSHGGFAFSIQIFVPQGATCTVENIDEDNPLAAVVKNCTLSGTIKLKGLLSAAGDLSGSYQWSLGASFDANGIGTFTLTPVSLPTDRGVLTPRPSIPPFQETFAELLMMLY